MLRPNFRLIAAPTHCAQLLQAGGQQPFERGRVVHVVERQGAPIEVYGPPGTPFPSIL